MERQLSLNECIENKIDLDEDGEHATNTKQPKAAKVLNVLETVLKQKTR